jgi:murein DD-endopeptidase MepM/ murein hydrolase activator NlpD
MQVDFKSRADLLALSKPGISRNRAVVFSLLAIAVIVLVTSLWPSESEPLTPAAAVPAPEPEVVREEPAAPSEPLPAVPVTTTRDAQPERDPKPTSVTLPLALPASHYPNQDPAAPPLPQESGWLEETVKNGDSLALIFSRLGLSPTLLYNITHSSEDAKELTHIRPGETLRVRLNSQGGLQELIYRRSLLHHIKITPREDGFQTQVITTEPEVRTGQVSAVITDSLYLSAQRAGLSESLIMELANIFGWDIDFALGIRSGDRFSVLYQEEYLDGEKYRDGPILAAEFINRGKVFRAIRYTDEEGRSDYFTPDGKSMRKAFLRAPVDFRRISSRFSRQRCHPILGVCRPHRGVDYAAAIGTPIKAAGDGKIIFRGRKSGYGNAIIIQHGGRYSTLYGHLSKFRGGLYNGSRVKQGQIIGYVGMTGLATGPHLHYEFRVNGVHHNPLTVKLPDATPIAPQYLQDFRQQGAPLLAQLDIFSRTLLAQVEADRKIR